MPRGFSFRHSNETEISNIKAGHLSKIPLLQIGLAPFTKFICDTRARAVKLCSSW